MEKALAIQREVCRVLQTDQVFLCGGAVRDLVMNNTPKDYDFTTAMLPEDMIEKVKAAGRRVYTIGEKFGTIGFKVPYIEPPTIAKLGDPIADTTKESKYFEYVEVTTFRSEVYTNKSRKPEVKFVPSLDEDLARRDFTFNAMVLRSDGSIYDPYGGRLDLHAGLIKTVGLPKDRIQEDPLRILRAARFAARYGFDIDPNFIGKARQLADRIFDVSVERWVQELDKLITSPYVVKGLDLLYEMEIAQRILPEVARPTLALEVSDDPDVMWKSLLDNINVRRAIKEPSHTIKYINSGIASRLKFSKSRTDFILDKPQKKD